MRRNSELPDPAVPQGITAADLDRTVRAELRGLTQEHAEDVGAHLAAVAAFIDEDPERAWRHAITARRKAARLGIVRETAGLAAYHSGRYADALSELRTARRLTGSNAHLAVMADSERGLGRPERALDLARGPEAKDLDGPTRIELLIVEAGARQDLGQDDAAVVTLQVKELDSPARTPAVARLRHAYADALAKVGRSDEADAWYAKARHADRDGSALEGVSSPGDFAPGELYEGDDEILDLLDDEDVDDEDLDGDDRADEGMEEADSGVSEQAVSEEPSAVEEPSAAEESGDSDEAEVSDVPRSTGEPVVAHTGSLFQEPASAQAFGKDADESDAGETDAGETDAGETDAGETDA